MEHDKKNWELSHLQALKQAEELKAEEEEEVMLTFPQEEIQEKVKRKRKRRRSFSDDDSLGGPDSLHDNVLNDCFDRVMDSSTPSRLRSQRRKRSNFLGDFDYDPGDDAAENGLKQRKTRSSTCTRRRVGMDVSGGTDLSVAKTKHSQSPSTKQKSSLAVEQQNSAISNLLPVQLSHGMVMTPVMVRPTEPGLVRSPTTVNYSVASGDVRPIVPTTMASSSSCNASGAPYMLVTVGPDGQPISRKVVTLPPNVVFRVVPMSMASGTISVPTGTVRVGSGTIVNQANQPK